MLTKTDYGRVILFTNREIAYQTAVDVAVEYNCFLPIPVGEMWLFDDKLILDSTCIYFTPKGEDIYCKLSNGREIGKAVYKEDFCLLWDKSNLVSRLINVYSTPESDTDLDSPQFCIVFIDANNHHVFTIWLRVNTPQEIVQELITKAYIYSDAQSYKVGSTLGMPASTTGELYKTLEDVYKIHNLIVKHGNNFVKYLIKYINKIYSQTRDKEKEVANLTFEQLEEKYLSYARNNTRK